MQGTHPRELFTPINIELADKEGPAVYRPLGNCHSARRAA
jgi:hypothetical protein